MEHWLSISILAVLVLQLVFAGLVVAFVVGKVRVAGAQVAQFVSPVSVGQPSPIATATEAVSEMFARSIMASAKMTFAGLSSGHVRREAAVDGDIAEDSAKLAHPMVTVLLDQFPQLRKTLRKNPGMLDYALAKLAEKGSAGGLGGFFGGAKDGAPAKMDGVPPSKING